MPFISLLNPRRETKDVAVISHAEQEIGVVADTGVLLLETPRKMNAIDLGNVGF